MAPRNFVEDLANEILRRLPQKIAEQPQVQALSEGVLLRISSADLDPSITFDERFDNVIVQYFKNFEEEFNLEDYLHEEIKILGDSVPDSGGECEMLSNSILDLDEESEMGESITGSDDGPSIWDEGVYHIEDSKPNLENNDITQVEISSALNVSPEIPNIGFIRNTLAPRLPETQPDSFNPQAEVGDESGFPSSPTELIESLITHSSPEELVEDSTVFPTVTSTDIDTVHLEVSSHATKLQAPTQENKAVTILMTNRDSIPNAVIPNEMSPVSNWDDQSQDSLREDKPTSDFSINFVELQDQESNKVPYPNSVEDFKVEPICEPEVFSRRLPEESKDTINRFHQIGQSEEPIQILPGQTGATELLISDVASEDCIVEDDGIIEEKDSFEGPIPLGLDLTSHERVQVASNQETSSTDAQPLGTIELNIVPEDILGSPMAPEVVPRENINDETSSKMAPKPDNEVELNSSNPTIITQEPLHNINYTYSGGFTEYQESIIKNTAQGSLPTQAQTQNLDLELVSSPDTRGRNLGMPVQAATDFSHATSRNETDLEPIPKPEFLSKRAEYLPPARRLPIFLQAQPIIGIHEDDVSEDDSEPNAESFLAIQDPEGCLEIEFNSEDEINGASSSPTFQLPSTPDHSHKIQEKTFSTEENLPPKHLSPLNITASVCTGAGDPDPGDTDSEFSKDGILSPFSGSPDGGDGPFLDDLIPDPSDPTKALTSPPIKHSPSFLCHDLAQKISQAPHSETENKFLTKISMDVSQASGWIPHDLEEPGGTFSGEVGNNAFSLSASPSTLEEMELEKTKCLENPTKEDASCLGEEENILFTELGQFSMSANEENTEANPQHSNPLNFHEIYVSQLSAPEIPEKQRDLVTNSVEYVREVNGFLGEIHNETFSEINSTGAISETILLSTRPPLAKRSNSRLWSTPSSTLSSVHKIASWVSTPKIPVSKIVQHMASIVTKMSPLPLSWASPQSKTLEFWEAKSPKLRGEVVENGHPINNDSAKSEIECSGSLEELTYPVPCSFPDIEISLDAPLPISSEMVFENGFENGLQGLNNTTIKTWEALTSNLISVLMFLFIPALNVLEGVKDPDIQLDRPFSLIRGVLLEASKPTLNILEFSASNPDILLESLEKPVYITNVSLVEIWVPTSSKKPQDFGTSYPKAQVQIDGHIPPLIHLHSTHFLA
ncbi:hypothetical protein H072_4652 [Dactylellina haptotyla CBS 200.50]|uniref:Uncharacterized protein n=1 Tax=Dactylellina haptotyla (strain CBS 200.50) TaxID=1284197 RepID=S8BPW2_DACHA|nr:hypothetical protein H072_4652 [Dactylellina haptotyla CBS 200.50]